MKIKCVQGDETTIHLFDLAWWKNKYFENGFVIDW